MNLQKKTVDEEFGNFISTTNAGNYDVDINKQENKN
jgi:hypothetical protein